jgi:hypothetical protein
MTTATATMPPDIIACHACGTPDGSRERRRLCRRCYSDGPTRSSFDAQGRRLAKPLPQTLSWNDQDQDPDEAPAAGPVPVQPTRSGTRRRLANEAEQRLRDRADETALLAAVDALVTEGRYVADDGQVGAGAAAAGLLAGLPKVRAEEAVGRLVAAGVLRRLPTRFLRAPGGRPGRGKRTGSLARVAPPAGGDPAPA